MHSYIFGMNSKLSRHLFMQMARGSFSSKDDFGKVKNRLKFTLRGTLQLPHTLRWLDFLSRHAELLSLLRQRPRLALKPHRPYLMQSLGTAERVRILMSHYRLLKRLFSRALYQQLLDGQDILLAALTGKDGRHYSVVLTKFHNFDREGELSLHIDDPEGRTLAVITFVLYEYRGTSAILIAGLQGPKHCPHETIKEATKNCHGLFPKKLAMEALMALSRSVGVSAIHAISKEAHIYNVRRYRKHWEGFEADYNSFWKELGGTALNRDLYLLPNHIYHKPIEEVESKKRAEHRRRYALLSELQAHIQTRIAL